MPPNKTEFDAGTLELNQFVGNVDVEPRVPGPRPWPARSTSPSGAEYRRENYQITPGEPDSYGDGGVPNQFGGRAAIGAQVFPGFRPANEVDASRNSVAGYVDVEGDVTHVASARRRRTHRALQRLRQHRGRQAHCARAAGPAVRRARLDQHGLPRAVARAVVLFLDRDQLPQPRARAWCPSSR